METLEAKLQDTIKNTISATTGAANKRLGLVEQILDQTPTKRDLTHIHTNLQHHLNATNYNLATTMNNVAALQPTTL